MTGSSTFSLSFMVNDLADETDAYDQSRGPGGRATEMSIVMEGQNPMPSPHVHVYVDMVGDLFHPGHVALLKAAREFGDWLIVGVLSDEVVSSYKRRPIMSLAERVAVIEACRYVDEVLPGAPYTVTAEFLEEHDIAVVVHGDDLSADAVEEVFGPVAAAGRLRLVKYTAGVSTTELISRAQERMT